MESTTTTAIPTNNNDNTKKKILVVHGGELAKDVSERIRETQPQGCHVTLTCASDRPRKLLDRVPPETILCFVMQTIENESPTEEGGTLLRYFQRKTHPSDLFALRKYAVLGLGDSNLLLDRQTTSAKDCNQVGQALDARLEALGGDRLGCGMGMADERTGLHEIELWIPTFWKSVLNQ